MKHLIVLIIALLIPAAVLAGGGKCAGDKQKFCKGVSDTNACLKQHKAELSAACQAKREATKKEQAPAEKH
jgi:hypothetical protein